MVPNNDASAKYMRKLTSQEKTAFFTSSARDRRGGVLYNFFSACLILPEFKGSCRMNFNFLTSETPREAIERCRKK